MSLLNVNAVEPSTGTDITLGASGDTITVPSGATFTQSGTMNASAITAGTVATARLGSGTADATTFLRGDQTYAAPAGKIGQVSAMAQTYTQTSFTTQTLTDWSGMTCALTPVATSSKIIIMGAAHIYSGAANNVNISLLRDDGGGFDELIALGDYVGLEAANADLLPICFVDSPSVTVEVTYKLQYRSDTGGSCYLNVNDGGNSPTNQEGSNSYLYCMEVLA